MSLRLRTPEELAFSLFALTLANLVVFLADLIVAQTLAILVLTVLLPGFPLLALLPQRHGDARYDVQRLIMGLGLGYTIAIAGTLFLHYLPGPMTKVSTVLLYDVLILGLLAAQYAIGEQRMHPL